ncbi:glycerophosphodiester phosphodiesterase family protein [Pedobacter sp. SL55]|uniref:glycerophosphodiester phosphodiesterase family protein n=1 Tax=Pedobacter sp. SL55 TaxID=2995161 RepID=UPI00226DD84F|nr:glycerophosphodiester phosphodiesterase family protein [Pedobacter sp. SL55]WAC41804.1 glycerophosphodiester phosphodiesterase family protein [Pedobacter sp. SL55]
MNKRFFVAILAIMITGTALAQKQIKSWNKNLVIAHRGAWKTQNLPENSIASLKEAIKIGCFGSEFDVQFTKDNIAVVNHNGDFLGKDIASSTLPGVSRLQKTKQRRKHTNIGSISESWHEAEENKVDIGNKASKNTRKGRGFNQCGNCHS